MSVGEGRDAVFENVALRIQWRECDFPHRLTVNLMLMTSQAGHVASVDLLAEQAIVVVIVGDGVAQDRAVNSLCSSVTSLSGVRIHFAPQTDELSHDPAPQFVFELSNNFLVRRRVERVVGWIVGGVVLVEVVCHVRIDVIRFDVDNDVVRVRVAHSNAVSIKRLQMSVVKVKHNHLGQVKNSHPHKNRLAEMDFGLPIVDSHNA